MHSSLHTLIVEHPHFFHELVDEECQRRLVLPDISPSKGKMKQMMDPLLLFSLRVRDKLGEAEDLANHVALSQFSSLGRDDIAHEPPVDGLDVVMDNSSGQS